MRCDDMNVTINTTLQELLNWEDVCKKYPDVWVMVGYPESEAYQLNWKNRKGVVLYYSSNEQEFADFSEANIDSFKETQLYKRYFTNYTGKLPSQPLLKRAGVIQKIAENE